MCKELKLSGKQSTQENKFIFIIFLRQRVKRIIGQEIKKNKLLTISSQTIPQSFGMLEGLQMLVLYNNSLEGLLPRDLIHLKNLTNVNFWNNKLNGRIIPLCGSSFLKTLDLTNNRFFHGKSRPNWLIP